MTSLFRRLIALCLLIAPAMNAQTPQLKLVVILSRHGVRSPTWTQDRLNAFSAQPWPTWPVPPGELTPHGFDLLTRLGSQERATLAEKGLFAATGCADAESVFIYADSDQRTLASGRALAQGLFPTCPPPLHALPEGTNDPLFHADVQPTPTETAAGLAELTQRLNVPTNLPDLQLIAQLQRILLGCTLQADCTPEHPPTSLLPTGPLTAVPGKGDHIVDLKGALPTASTLSEDLLLEYADAMPPANVGWGHVDEDHLRSLLALHTTYFDLLHRTPTLARLSNGELLHHIALTLRQGIEDKPIHGALGNPGQKLVLLVGHDTNLAAIASLLGLHWTLDGRTDDTPPGTELAFELWQTAPPTPDHPATYTVRTTVTQQTLAQMHDSTRASATPPVYTPLVPKGCTTAACPWSTFLQATQ
jgi:4-phytase/acid phosphatase